MVTQIMEVILHIMVVGNMEVIGVNMEDILLGDTIKAEDMRRSGTGTKLMELIRIILTMVDIILHTIMVDTSRTMHLMDMAATDTQITDLPVTMVDGTMVDMDLIMDPMDHMVIMEDTIALDGTKFSAHEQWNPISQQTGHSITTTHHHHRQSN